MLDRVSLMTEGEMEIQKGKNKYSVKLFDKNNKVLCEIKEPFIESTLRTFLRDFDLCRHGDLQVKTTGFKMSVKKLPNGRMTHIFS
jgi:hypothetical protein